MERKHLVRSGILAVVVLIVLLSVVLILRTSKPSFSPIDAKVRPFYETALGCPAKSDRLLTFAHRDDVRLMRLACDASVLKKMPQPVLQELELQDGETAEVLLFVENGWFGKKVRVATASSGGFAKVLYTVVDKQPSVLVESSPTGSGGFSDWMLVTALPTSSIGVAARHDDEQQQKDILRAGEVLKSSHPSIHGDTLFAESWIQRAADPNCCPSGGVAQIRYKLQDGTLESAGIRRLTTKQVEQIASSSLPPRNPDVTSMADTPGLTKIGVFSDAPIAVNIGVPCPNSGSPDLPGAAQKRDTRNTRSCDYVLLFRELTENKVRSLPMLYRGPHPPATIRELCQVKYSGDLMLPPKGEAYNIDFALKHAAKMPRLESVEEPTDRARQEFFNSVQDKEWTMMRAQGVSFYNKSRAKRRKWY